MSKKRIVLLVITIIVLLVTLFSASFAFFNSKGLLGNTSVDVNVANRSILTSAGGNIVMDIPTYELRNEYVGNVIATGSDNLVVTLLAGIDGDVTCGYDVMYKYEPTSNAYVLSKEGELEFTYTIVGSDLNIPETNFANTSEGEQKLNVNRLTITNSSETVPTEKQYQITTKFYNINANQDANTDKHWQVKFYIDDIVCNIGNEIPYGNKKIRAVDVDTSSGKDLQETLEDLLEIFD